MSTARPIRLGFWRRLHAAGSLVVRGNLPWTAEVLDRFFGGGASGDRPSRSYSQVAAVYACVKARSEAIAGMPLMISAGDDEVIESGTLVALAEQPNPKMTGRAFGLATSALLDLFGRVHWVMELDGMGRPTEVYPVSPVQMTPNPDRRTGKVLLWKYRAAGRIAGQEETLPPERVHTIIDPDFEDVHNPLKGLSPRTAVAMAISQYYKADLANEVSLDNGVEPGGALQTDREISDGQRRELREWIADHHSGVRNRRRFMLLEGGLTWQRIGAAFKEMAFAELKKMSRADICAGFSVPGPGVNYYEDSNYAHAKAAEELFYINTIVPRAGRLAEEWDRAILSRYQGDRSLGVTDAQRRSLERHALCCHGFRSARRAAPRGRRQFYAWFDSSQAPAVQRANLAQAEQAKRWFEMGVPLNDILQATDAPFQEQPYGNVGYKPIGLEPFGTDTLDTISDPDGSEPESGLLPDASQSAVPAARAAREAQTVLRATEHPRARLWALWRKSWEPLEGKMHSRVRRHFYELRSETLANLARVADQLGGPRNFTADQRREVIGEVLFNLEAADRGLLVKVGNLIREGYRLGGAQAMQEAADAPGQEAPDPFRIKAPIVQDKLRQRQIRLRDVNRTLRRRLARQLADAIDQGQTVEQIAEAIKGEFNFARSRAAVIARTEIGGAVEEARHEGRMQAGVPMKSWLHSRKEHGRPTHAATEAATMAQPVASDQLFTIAGTGVTCQPPRGTGDPGHDINCGCTTPSRHPNDSLKAVLSRYAQRGFLSYSQLNQRDAEGSASPAPGKEAAHAATP